MSDVSVTAHRHNWKTRARIDGCHFTQLVRLCRDCGAQSAAFEERDFREDPMAICFADRGCPRCVELAADAGFEEEGWVWRLRP